jgi:HEAT repeat protein
VSAVVKRTEDPLTPLGTAITRSSPDVARALVQALGLAGRAEGLELLGSLLGDSSELDADIVMQLGLLGARLPNAVDPSTTAEVRSFLWSNDPGLVRTSLIAVAQMRDDEAVPDLIELLADGEPAVRESAHWALQQITGLGLTAQPEHWRTWFEAEEAWFDDRAMDLRDQLGRASSKQVVSALCELARHRWRRHETATRIEKLLRHSDPALRALACIVLGQLGSNRSVEPLRGAVEDPDASVRQAAASALTALE